MIKTYRLFLSVRLYVPCDAGHIRVEERAPEEGNADTEAPDQDSSLAAGVGGH